MTDKKEQIMTVEALGLQMKEALLLRSQINELKEDVDSLSGLIKLIENNTKSIGMLNEAVAKIADIAGKADGLKTHCKSSFVKLHSQP